MQERRSADAQDEIPLGHHDGPDEEERHLRDDVACAHQHRHKRQQCGQHDRNDDVAFCWAHSRTTCVRPEEARGRQISTGDDEQEQDREAVLHAEDILDDAFQNAEHDRRGHRAIDIAEARDDADHEGLEHGITTHIWQEPESELIMIPETAASAAEMPSTCA